MNAPGTPLGKGDRGHGLQCRLPMPTVDFGVPRWSAASILRISTMQYDADVLPRFGVPVNSTDSQVTSDDRGCQWLALKCQKIYAHVV